MAVTLGTRPSQVERMYVDDNMVKSAIERGDSQLAQTFILYMQLDILRMIQRRSESAAAY